MQADTLQKIVQINQALAKRFPNHNDPFHMLARLMEESGELAEQIHIFENMGIKQQKHGPPDRQKLAKELQDILRCVMQITLHYQVEDELRASIDNSLARL